MSFAALVTSISETPVAARFAADSIPVPAVATEWPIVLFYNDHAEVVEAALAALPVFPLYPGEDADPTFGPLDGAAAAELRALVPVVAHVHAVPPGKGCPFDTALTYPYVVAALVAAPKAVVIAALSSAKIPVGTVASLPEKLRKSLETFVASESSRYEAMQIRWTEGTSSEALLAAVPALGPRKSPTLVGRWRAFLATHPKGVTSAVWKALIAYDYDSEPFAPLFDAEHARNAVGAVLPEQVDLTELLTIAAKAAAAAPKAKSSKKQPIEAADPAEAALLAYAEVVGARRFLEAVDRAVQRCDKGAVPKKAFWTALANYVTKNPLNPLEVPPADATAGQVSREHHLGAHTTAIYVVGSLGKPTGAAQEALIAWCNAHPGSFGAYTSTFAKRIGAA